MSDAPRPSPPLPQNALIWTVDCRAAAPACLRNAKPRSNLVHLFHKAVASRNTFAISRRLAMREGILVTPLERLGTSHHAFGNGRSASLATGTAHTPCLGSASRA